MIIDFHNHYYPPEYLDAVKEGPAQFKLDYDAEGNPRLHYPGDYNILVPGHRDLDYREKRARRARRRPAGDHVHHAGRAHRGSGDRPSRWRGASTTRSRDERQARKPFTSLATLPLNDPAASVARAERRDGALGLPGAMVFSNVNGVALADAALRAAVARRRTS